MGTCCESEQDSRPGQQNKPVNPASLGKKPAAKKPRDKPLLIYFPIHGKAEPIRLLANYCKLDFEDKRVSFDEFANLKKAGKLPAG